MEVKSKMEDNNLMRRDHHVTRRVWTGQSSTCTLAKAPGIKVGGDIARFGRSTTNQFMIQ